MTIEEIRHLNGYQFVRLTMTDGTVFEGEAIHDPADYCFHEFGQDEEAVEIDHWLFYLSDIASLEPSEESDGNLWMSRPLHRMHLDPQACAAMEDERKTIELRLDANGAFKPDDALLKLERLAHYDIHSIEQPIRQGQWEAMARLCRLSPIPIALDEELIEVIDPSRKTALLQEVHPAYIILKPSLHGGMRGTREWIETAARHGVGTWITSALESNVGLNAIAQLAAQLYGPDIRMPQGLGTGQLFTDNLPMPLLIEGDRLWRKA